MIQRDQALVRLNNLSTLHQGKPVEARHQWSDPYRGKVESVVPRLNILWLEHGPFNERTLIDLTEYEIWGSAA